MTCWMKAGVGNVRTFDQDEAAAWLAMMDRWLDKPWEKHKALEVWDRSREQAVPPEADPAETLMAKVAAQLPAIDWGRGWSAARHFDSVESMINASREDWEQVPKIGPVIAKSAVEAIRRRKG